MKACKPNLALKGRLLRGAAGLGLLAVALALVKTGALLASAVALLAALTLLEALWGWCLLRACGIKTRF